MTRLSKDRRPSRVSEVERYTVRASQISWEIKVYFFLVQQRDTVLALCATRVFFPAMADGATRGKPAEGKRIASNMFILFSKARENKQTTRILG